MKKKDTKSTRNQCTHSKSGVVGVFALEELLYCDDGETVLVIIRSAGTDTLRANSLLATVVTRDFRCLLELNPELNSPNIFRLHQTEILTRTENDLPVAERRWHVY